MPNLMGLKSIGKHPGNPANDSIVYGKTKKGGSTLIGRNRDSIKDFFYRNNSNTNQHVGNLLGSMNLSVNVDKNRSLTVQQ